MASRPRDVCRIAFVGKDWKRKGGDLVVKTVELLNRRGLKTSLTVVGCTPPIEANEHVTVHPFLDKTVPHDWRIFADIMYGSHFFFMPSQAEASPHALCEASAFGLPSISSTAGGIPTIIREAVTGYARPSDASPAVFADLIQRTFLDEPRYRAMCRSARQDFEERLNWPQFARKLSDRIYQAL